MESIYINVNCKQRTKYATKMLFYYEYVIPSNSNIDLFDIFILKFLIFCKELVLVKISDLFRHGKGNFYTNLRR